MFDDSFWVGCVGCLTYIFFCMLLLALGTLVVLNVAKLVLGL